MPLDVARMWHDFTMADKDNWWSWGWVIGATIGLGISRVLEIDSWLKYAVATVCALVCVGIENLIQKRKS
jgi:hypothetical protein